MTLFSRPHAFARTLRRAINLSEAALWAEALAAALWPAFSLACLAVAVALLGGAEALGPIAHRAVLVGLGIALVAALAYGFWHFRLPSRGDAMRRLDATRPERPLAVMSDRLVGDGGERSTAQALWLEHQRRAEAAASDLRAGAPDLRLARRDGWALRLFAPTALLAAVIAAGPSAPDRLRAAIDPGAARAAADLAMLADPGYEAWAVPPVYTGVETVYLKRVADQDGPLSLPQNTEVTIRATGMAEAPALSAALLDPLGDPLGAAAAGTGGTEAATASEEASEETGPTAPVFRDLGGGLWEVTGRVVRDGDLVLGPPDAPLARWQIEMIADTPPQIDITEPPAGNAARALEIAYLATDDHGVVSAWAVIDIADPAANRAAIDPIEIGLPLPISGDPTTVADQAVEDLTEHPFAGAEVVLTLYAEDAAGQRGTSGPIRLTLPERRFTDPLARALAEQRRELLLDYGEGERVLDVVQSVTRFPEAVFEAHAGAYLAVRLAMRRLAPAVVGEDVASVGPDVAEFLWRAALSLESGDLASALERLREAEERLRSALESGTDQEIREAIDELRQAMNEYLQEMVRQALENPDMMEQMPGQSQQQLSQQDFEEMLRQLEQQAESGLRDQARDMLSQLSQMLQNLQMGRMQQGQGEGQQALQELQDLIQRQQRLSEETFDALRQQRRQQQGQQGQQGQQQGQRGQQGQQGQRQGQGGQQGEQGRSPGQQAGRPGEGGARSGQHSENGRLAAEQEALRRALDELAGQLGGGEGMDGASRALDDAGRSMGDARDDLDQGSAGQAVQDQLEALDRLNEGAQALADQLEQQGQGQASARGMNDGRGPAQDRDEVDPFDRPSGSYGAIDGSSTDVPNQALIDRARELLEELRRRSSERERPDLELRYFERLLDQF